MTNHFRVLGIPPTASAAEVKAAYRTKARELHPDAGGAASAFVELQAAYDVLSDAETRAAWQAEYTAWAAGLGALVCPTCFTAQRTRAGVKNRCAVCRQDLGSEPPPSRLSALRDDLVDRAGDFLLDIGARLGDEIAEATITAVDRGLSTLERRIRRRRRR